MHAELNLQKGCKEQNIAYVPPTSNDSLDEIKAWRETMKRSIKAVYQRKKRASMSKDEKAEVHKKAVKRRRVRQLKESEEVREKRLVHESALKAQRQEQAF